MSEAHNEILIRPAEERDRAGLEHIASRTWDGTDYLPKLITDWLAEGEFYVAVQDDRVVGSGKLTRFADDEWWLEGLRVDPDFHRQGVARLMHHHLVDRADKIGHNGILRLATASLNTAVHKLCDETGFKMVGHYLRYAASTFKDERQADQFELAAPGEVQAVIDFLESSPFYPHAQHSTMGVRWRCEFITRSRLEAWCAQSLVYQWRRPAWKHGERNRNGIVIFDPQSLPNTERSVMYLDAVAGEFANIAQALRGLAARLGADRVRVMLLTRPERLVAIEQAGWRRPADNSGSAYLFSRSLSAEAAK